MCVALPILQQKKIVRVSQWRVTSGDAEQRGSLVVRDAASSAEGLIFLWTFILLLSKQSFVINSKFDINSL